MNFSDKDLAQFDALGVSLTSISEQLDNFKKGFPFLKLEKAATVGDGIQRYDAAEVAHLQAFYETQSQELKICKFVPASGAASRMFKDLFEFMESYDQSEAAKAEFYGDVSFYSPYYFIQYIRKFAFYEDLKAVMANDSLNLDITLKYEDFVTGLLYLLTQRGLNYGNLPKGLLKFHHYETGNRTAIEEHLVEAANYAKTANGEAFLHFTVSPEHAEGFVQKIAEVRETYEKILDTRFDVTFSEQKKYTDTIAVQGDFEPFRKEDGSILFRPGGHGALIENLNNLTADIVFIKNIDNVVPDRLKAETYTYKKVIGGVLLQYQQRIFVFQRNLDEAENPLALIPEIRAFYERELCTIFNDFDEKTPEEQLVILQQKLNRPIRVCGMVKNEGEPGGGPFWARNADGSVGLQIVESSQVNTSDVKQKEILQASSHFNPVDLVCSLTDYKGNRFQLLDYRDPQTGFITEKSTGGKTLLAQELPGLWNGAMSDWNTIFVEVPLITFNPVKKVNDLLRPEHS